MRKFRVKPVEIIVVTAIILGVVALLWPTCGCASEKARQVTCASNMKQLWLGFSQYAQDNDGNLPNVADAKNANTTWRSAIFPYARSKGLFLCPDHNNKLNNPDSFPVSYAANFTGDYSGSKNNQGNGAFAGPGSNPIHFNNIEHPESLIMLCEVSHTDRPDFNIDALGALDPDNNILWAGHNPAGSNYLFNDGHVKWLHPLGTKDWWHRNASIPLSAGAIKILQNAEDRAGK